MTKLRSHTLKKQQRWIMIGHIAWLGTLVLLAGWWGHVLHQQSLKIAELGLLSGLPNETVETQLLKTHRMLYWEGSAFFVILLASMLFLIWLYWRDQKRTRSVEAFFASVSHELRTPLTSIRLQAEALAESSRLEGPEHTLIGRLLEDTLRLESQVERSLELARLEGGGPVFLEPLPLKAVTEKILLPWLERPSKNIKIKNQIKNETILADLSALQTILRNLLENTIRHTKSDSLHLSLESSTQAAHVILHIKNDQAISKLESHDLGKLFNKGPQSKGAGVGLYLVNELMMKMNGKAYYQMSDQGEFEVKLQFAKGE